MYFLNNAPAEQPINQDNAVTINIWLPVTNGAQGTAISHIARHSTGTLDPNLLQRVGHVSLHTPNHYVSWWPNPANNEQIGIYNVISAQNNTYENDKFSEGTPENPREPDYRVTLYSLDVAEMENAFQEIEQSDFGYVLAGDKKATRIFNSRRGQSCSGLAYELLEIGGIFNLVKIHQNLKAKWIVVPPEDLASLVKNAKYNELTQHPETEPWATFPDEYIPEPAMSRCNIL